MTVCKNYYNKVFPNNKYNKWLFKMKNKEKMKYFLINHY